jgi:hypothetical protein
MADEAGSIIAVDAAAGAGGLAAKWAGVSATAGEFAGGMAG